MSIDIDREQYDYGDDDISTMNYVLAVDEMVRDYQLEILRWCNNRGIDPHQVLQPVNGYARLSKLEFSFDGYVEALKQYLEFTLYRGSTFNKTAFIPTDESILLIHPWLKDNSGYHDYLLGLAAMLDRHWKFVESKLTFKPSRSANGYNLWYYTMAGTRRMVVTNAGDVRLIEQRYYDTSNTDT